MLSSEQLADGCVGEEFGRVPDEVLGSAVGEDDFTCFVDHQKAGFDALEDSTEKSPINRASPCHSSSDDVPEVKTPT
nr:hypothetical protein [Salinigranum halophilum]